MVGRGFLYIVMCLPAFLTSIICPQMVVTPNDLQRLIERVPSWGIPSDYNTGTFKLKKYSSETHAGTAEKAQCLSYLPHVPRAHVKSEHYMVSSMLQVG